MTHRPVLLGLVLLLAGCAVPLRSAPPPVLAPVPVPAALPGVALVPVDRLLLTPRDLPGYQLDGTAGQQLHPGPGLASATSRFVQGQGSSQRLLYLRLGEFPSVAAVTTEYRDEGGDIGRSSTALDAKGEKLGDDWLAYTVVSGAGSAATGSVGLLVRERNFLCSMVLTGPPNGVHLADLLPLAQRQVARLATAR